MEAELAEAARLGLLGAEADGGASRGVDFQRLHERMRSLVHEAGLAVDGDGDDEGLWHAAASLVGSPEEWERDCARVVAAASAHGGVFGLSQTELEREALCFVRVLLASRDAALVDLCAYWDDSALVDVADVVQVYIAWARVCYGLQVPSELIRRVVMAPEGPAVARVALAVELVRAQAARLRACTSSEDAFRLLSSVPRLTTCSESSVLGWEQVWAARDVEAVGRCRVGARHVKDGGADNDVSWAELCDKCSGAVRFADVPPVRASLGGGDARAGGGGDLRARGCVLLLFAIALVLVVPLFWWTCGVYKADLPAPSVALPSSRPPRPRLFLVSVAPDDGHAIPTLTPQDVPCVEARIQMSTRDIALASRDVGDDDDALDDALTPHEVSADSTCFTVFLFFNASEGAGSSPRRLIVGKHRHAWLRVGPPFDTAAALRGAICTHVYERLLLYSSPGALHELPAAPSIHLSFTLLQAQPTASSVVTWAFDLAQRVYLDPFLDKIAHIVHTRNVESQVRYHGALPEELSGFVGSTNSWNLESPLAASADTAVEFLLYVPPRPAPEGGDNSTSISPPSFIVPRWGGVVVLDAADAEQSHLDVALLRRPMGKFLAQLRMLLGLPATVHHYFDNYHDLSDAGDGKSSAVDWIAFVERTKGGAIADWECDHLARSRMQAYLGRSSEQLSSLYELLANFTHMPVNDNIQANVVRAQQLYSRAVSSETVEAAVASARESLEAANAATFDPSMIPLMYFPNEHIYAVFAPFFAPVAIHLLVTAIKLCRAYRHRSVTQSCSAS